MNAETFWEQEYNRPNGLSVEKAPKSNLYLFTFTCRKAGTWDRFFYFPSGGRHVEEFYAGKNPTASVGFEPANLATKCKRFVLFVSTLFFLPFRQGSPTFILLCGITELKIHFKKSFSRLCLWVWNLISRDKWRKLAESVRELAAKVTFLAEMGGNGRRTEKIAHWVTSWFVIFTKHC